MIESSSSSQETQRMKALVIPNERSYPVLHFKDIPLFLNGNASRLHQLKDNEDIINSAAKIEQIQSNVESPRDDLSPKQTAVFEKRGDIENQKHELFQKKNFEDEITFKIPKQFESEVTTLPINNCGSNQESCSSQQKIKSKDQSMLFPVLNYSKFLLKTSSSGQIKMSSEEQSHQQTGQGYNDGWVASQFDPDFDSNQKKEIYIMTKMIEMQFDLTVAKGVLSQITLNNFSREEILQMVCETMLSHSKQVRQERQIGNQLQTNSYLVKLAAQKIDKIKEKRNNLRKSDETNSIQLSPLKSNFYQAPIPEMQQEQQQQQQQKDTDLPKTQSNDPPTFLLSPKLPEQKNKNIIPNLLEKSSFSGITVTHSQAVFRTNIFQTGMDKEKSYVCGICCNEYLGSEFIKLCNCNHTFCIACWHAYLISKIKKSEVQRIFCPETNCTEIIQDSSIQQALPSNQYDLFQKLKKITALNLNQEIRWCPTLNCGELLQGNKNQPCLKCPKCKKNMCFLCNNSWHEGTCEQAMEKYLTDLKKTLQTKSCPHCKGEILKYQKCNHMKCWKCGYEFCWICKSNYSKFHFKKWNCFGCPGKMFALEDAEEKQKNSQNNICEKIFSFCYNTITFILQAFLVLLIFVLAIAAYLFLVIFAAYLTPIIIAYDRFQKEVDKQSEKYSGCYVNIFLLAIGLGLYPFWVVIAIVPGICFYWPKMYTLILYAVFDEDQYE